MAGRETRETTIDGCTYRVTQLGATTGAQVMFRLGRAFAAVMASVSQGELDLAALSPSDFDWIVVTMKASTKFDLVDTVGGGTVRTVDLAPLFDEHFAGRYGQMLEWLKFALEVNFGPLADAVRSVLSGVTALSDSSRPKAATGSAGASSSASG